MFLLQRFFAQLHLLHCEGVHVEAFRLLVQFGHEVLHRWLHLWRATLEVTWIIFWSDEVGLGADFLLEDGTRLAKLVLLPTVHRMPLRGGKLVKIAWAKPSQRWSQTRELFDVRFRLKRHHSERLPQGGTLSGLLNHDLRLGKGNLAQRGHELLTHRVQVLLSDHLVLFKFKLALHDVQLVVLRGHLRVQMVYLRRLLLEGS